MDVETVKLRIKLEPEGETGVPIDMLRDFFMAHQETLGIIIREENKEGSIPELRLIDVQHGSWDFHFLVQGLQTVLPLAESFLAKMANVVQDQLSGMDTFEETTTTTTTRKRRIPKRITDRLSTPFLAGLIKQAEVYEDEDTVPLYSISSTEVQPVALPEELEVLSITEPKLEQGDIQELTGELREIDWEKKTCRFFVEIDGYSKAYKCVIQDNAFLDEEVRNNLPVKIYAIPVYSTSTLGERSIKFLEAVQITKLEI